MNDTEEVTCQHGSAPSQSDQWIPEDTCIALRTWKTITQTYKNDEWYSEALQVMFIVLVINIIDDESLTGHTNTDC